MCVTVYTFLVTCLGVHVLYCTWLHSANFGHLPGPLSVQFVYVSFHSVDVCTVLVGVWFMCDMCMTRYCMYMSPVHGAL